MSKQKVDFSGNAGRDQYNISGDKTKLKVDNRTASTSNGGWAGKFILEVAVAVTAGLLLFYLLGVK